MKKIFIFSVLMLLVLSGCTLLGSGKKVLTVEEAKAKAVDFINSNLMAQGREVSVKEAIEENGLYKVVINIPGGQNGTDQEMDTYITKDGTKFFPQVLDIVEYEAKMGKTQANEQAVQAQAVADVPKSEQPKVDVFVMSHCPYGTQIEKGVLPVARLLGDKIDFDIKFCDYAMHGKTEVDEQLNQYCIQKTQPAKFFDYLECFLGSGKTQDCLIEAKVDTSKVSSCVKETDIEFGVTASLNDQSTWLNGRYPIFAVNQEEAKKYGVTGSPGLVINGKKVNSKRDSASLLSTICAAFENPPEECNETLSGTTPSTGFGGGTASSDSGGCG